MEGERRWETVDGESERVNTSLWQAQPAREARLRKRARSDGPGLVTRDASRLVPFPSGPRAASAAARSRSVMGFTPAFSDIPMASMAALGFYGCSSVTSPRLVPVRPGSSRTSKARQPRGCGTRRRT
jgi:hypothetical protein